MNAELPTFARVRIGALSQPRGRTIRVRPVLSLLAFSFITLAAGAASPWTYHDDSFRSVAPADAQPEFIAGGFNGCEGAQWIPEPGRTGGGHLRFGAVHTDVAFRWDETNGLRGLRSPSFEASAFRPHPAGGLIVAEQTTRQLVRYESDGRVTVLVDRFEGKRLNRPNDIAVRRDGSVWFTDPDYLFKQRPQETKELAGQYVFRFDPATAELRAVVTDLKLPNGIAFTPNESTVYIGDSGAGTVDCWPVLADGTLGARASFVRPRHGGPDGLTVDAAGNVWIASAKAVEVFSSAGKPLAELVVPGKRPAATAIGGSRGEWLFVCTRDAVWRLKLNPQP